MNVADVARVLRHRTTFRLRDRWSRPQLLAHQTRSLDALRKFTYERSPFYRKFHAGLLDRPLEDLPVLTKSEMMLNFDDVVTGLAAGSPLRRSITGRFRCRELTSVLYVAHWPDGDHLARALDNRIPQPEVAVL